MAVVKLAYRFALDPTPVQERALRSHAGAARFAWNWGLARCKARYEAEGKWYSAVDLHKLWNSERKADPALGWWGENSKCAYQEAFRNQGFATARRMLSYKTGREGGTLLIADRWYPSSKLCSSCGRRKPSLTLKDRVFACGHCGHVEDRDVNAARNLLNLAASGTERQNACGGTVRPGHAGHVPLKQEPGTPHGGKTGTAAPQGTAAA